LPGLSKKPPASVLKSRESILQIAINYCPGC